MIRELQFHRKRTLSRSWKCKESHDNNKKKIILREITLLCARFFWKSSFLDNHLPRVEEAFPAFTLALVNKEKNHLLYQLHSRGVVLAYPTHPKAEKKKEKPCNSLCSFPHRWILCCSRTAQRAIQVLAAIRACPMILLTQICEVEFPCGLRYLYMRMMLYNS